MSLLHCVINLKVLTLIFAVVLIISNEMQSLWLDFRYIKDVREMVKGAFVLRQNVRGLHVMEFKHCRSYADEDEHVF